MPIVTSGSNLTLVGALFGGRTERCQWMLEELNVDYQHDPMQVLKGVPSTMEEYEQNATHNPEVVALNPRAKIPLLKDASNDLLLAESAAINTYLGDCYGDGIIVPKAGTKERGLYDQWCYWNMAELDAQGWWTAYKFGPLGGKYSTAKSTDAAESARRYFLKQVNAAAIELKKTNAFICGENFTAADILMTHNLSMAKNFGWDFGANKEVFEAYLQRTMSRPAFQTVYVKKKSKM